MDTTTEEKINAARAEVSKSDLDPSHRDALQTRLDHAYKCSNGTPDKIAAIGAAVADGIVHEVRAEVRAPERFKKIVEDAIEDHEVRSEKRLMQVIRELLNEHLATCPVRAADQEAAKLGPLAARLGALGRAFSTLSVEGRIITAIIFLWAVQRFGVENILAWLGNLLGAVI